MCGLHLHICSQLCIAHNCPGEGVLSERLQTGNWRTHPLRWWTKQNKEKSLNLYLVVFMVNFFSSQFNAAKMGSERRKTRASGGSTIWEKHYEDKCLDTQLN